MKIRIIKTLFTALVIIFALMMAFFFAPIEQRDFFPYFGVLAIIFLILGILLVIFTFKSNIKGMLKIFLLLTGFAPPIAVVSSIMHNIAYGLLIFAFGEGIWDMFGGDEIFFFVISLLVCPLVFIIGMIGSIVMFVRKK